MTKRVIRIALAVLTLMTGAAAVSIGAAAPAGALCTASPLQGDWRNVDSATRAMSRVVVETCQPVTTCNGNICQTAHDAGTFMRPFGKCSPTDCDWGRRQASYLADGWIRSIYNFGFKTSHVWLKTYEYYGYTYLRVWVLNDFTSADGRTDYTTDEWFLR